MTSAQVVEMSVTNNSSFQNYTHPDDHTIRTKETIAGFQNKSVLELHLIKPFIAIHLLEKILELWFVRNVINREKGFVLNVNNQCRLPWTFVEIFEK